MKTQFVTRQRFEADDAYYQIIFTGFGDSLRNAFKSLPTYEIDYERSPASRIPPRLNWAKKEAQLLELYKT